MVADSVRVEWLFHLVSSVISRIRVARLHAGQLCLVCLLCSANESVLKVHHPGYLVPSSSNGKAWTYMQFGTSKEVQSQRLKNCFEQGQGQLLN